jgi:LmbE family N-acetylglucosaminyl deacetylase
MLVTAHPDDESFGPGGTLALLTDRGVSAHIVMATRGEAGTIFYEEMNRPDVIERLAEIREQEARCAAKALGVSEIDFLGYPDGGLAAADFREVTRVVAAAVRRAQPAVIITFGPDGVYGHADHVTIGRATEAAVALAADQRAQIDDLAPHQIDRLFYTVITSETAESLNSEMGPVMINGEAHPFAGYTADQITTRVDATEYAERKVAALLCHKTQTANRVDEIREWMTGEPLIENFVLAHAHAPGHHDLANDLVAGLCNG